MAVLGDSTATKLTVLNGIIGEGSQITGLNASNIASGTLSADRLATSGATAGNYGPGSNASPAHGASFSVPYFTVDNKGRITTAATRTITLPSDNNTDIYVRQNASTTASWQKVLLHGVANSINGAVPATTATEVYAAAGIEVQPSTGTLKAQVLATKASSSSIGDTTNGINFYNNSNIVGHIGVNGTPAMGLFANNSIYIRPGDGSILNSGGVVFSTSSIYASTDSSVDLGVSSSHWKAIYSDDIFVSSSTSFTGPTDGQSGVMINGAGSTELIGGTPYIDFHYNKNANDYTARIIADAESRIKLIGRTTAAAVTYNSRSINPLLDIEGNAYANGCIDSASYFLNNRNTTGGGYYLYGNNVEYAHLYIGAIGKAPTATTANDGTVTYSGAETGVTYLMIGNNKVSGNNENGVANNAKGVLRLYHSDNSYTDVTSTGWTGHEFNVVGSTNSTAGSTGSAIIIAGNANKKSEAKASSTGYLRLYSDENGYHQIYTTSVTTTINHTLPATSGWLATGISSGVGSSTQPIYMNSSGVLTAITGALANDITGNANTATTAGYATTAARATTAGYATTAANATTAGKLGTANVGTEYKPIYLVNGVATANHAFIPETGGTFTGDVNFNGNVSLNNETTADSLTAGSLLVNGQANFVQSPTAPTPENSSNDTTVATTEFVKNTSAKLSNSVYFVTGESTDTAGNWTGTIDSEVTEFYDGLTILYSPTVAGLGGSTDRTLTNDNATTVSLRNTCLKILGIWKPCYYQIGNTSNQTSNRLTTHYDANSVITFTYRTTANAGNGGWVAAADYNSNAPNYRQLDLYFRPYAATEAIYRYKICALDQDNRLVPLTITNQTSATNIDKTQTAKSFKPDNFWFYNSTTTTNANNVTPSQVLYKMYGDWAGPQYTFNTAIPAYTLTYLKGSFNTTTGLFTLDQTSHTSWQINIPTNTAGLNLTSYFTSGSYYILMGGSYSSANYFSFFEENPMYYFDGTNLKKISHTATSLATSGNTAQFYRGDNSWSNTLKHAEDTTLGINASTSIIGQNLKTLHFATKNAGSGTEITAGQTAGLTFGIENAAFAGIYYQSSGNYGSRLYFATTNLFADGAKARMIIDSTGKVGIGTVSPSSTLHVNGDTTITGTLVLSDTTDAAGGSDAKPALIVGGASTAQHIEIDANEILSKSNGTTPGTLYLQDSTGSVQVAGSGGLTVTSLSASQAVVTDANKKLVSRGIRNNTSANTLGWVSGNTTASNLELINVNTLAFWDGSYWSTNHASNLKYSANGEIMGLGTAQTVSGIKTFSAIQKFTNTTDAEHSTDTAAAVSVSGGMSVAKRVSAKEVKIDNGSTTKGVTMQYDSTLEVLNFVFA